MLTFILQKWNAQIHYKNVSHWCSIPVVIGVDTTGVISTTTGRPQEHDWRHLYDH